MFNTKTILFLIICLQALVLSQSVYVPLEFQAAYEDGTARLTGNPGLITGRTTLIIKFPRSLILLREC